MRNINNNSPYEIMYQILEKGDPIVLVTVVAATGSSPRKPGAFMLVQPGSRSYGTVGGGPVEAQVMDMAKICLAHQNSHCLEYSLDSSSSAEMGMECGGTMTILLEYYHATSENMNLLRSLIHVTNQASSHRLVRSGTFVDTTRVAIDHHIIPWKARSQGSSPFQIREQLQHHGIHLPAYALEDITTSNSTVFFLKYGPQPSSEEQMQHFISIERPISLEKLYIFGAGHIARSLAQMAVDLDFQVHVFDDREEFAHPRHFPDSTVVHVITDFEEVMNSLSVSSNDYIVIVTRGHQYDKTVLAQALATPAKYLGMIGSTRKKQVIYQQLIEDGWNWHELKRVYCPIGLSIGAQTPTEISLSILGQMIQTRRGQSRDQTIPATHFKP